MIDRKTMISILSDQTVVAQNLSIINLYIILLNQMFIINTLYNRILVCLKLCIRV